MGRHALWGVYIEIGLLFGIVINSLMLTFLLYETRKHLSTATILFIFNILFSNALFVASFICLFSDMFSDISYGNIEEVTFNSKLLTYHLGSPNHSSIIISGGNASNAFVCVIGIS